MAIGGLLKQVFSQVTRNHLVRQSTQNTAVRGQMPSANSLREESEFLAGIAHLPLDEQQRLIQKRAWYSCLAQRQGVVEAEHRPIRYIEEDKSSYRFY